MLGNFANSLAACQLDLGGLRSPVVPVSLGVEFCQLC
jgi:hypothetical protein